MNQTAGRCVIIGGAPIENPARIRAALKADDFCIYCDCGLRHLASLGAAPDCIVGDFDSYSGPLPDAPTITLPREKDDTDTVYAVKEALRRGFDEFLLVGAVGGRFDHSMANVSTLLMLSRLGKHAVLMDDHSDMCIVSQTPVDITPDCRYFSLLSIAGAARQVTIQNAKYPLERAAIEPEYQYGVSNEVLPGKIARVTVGEGALLLVRVYAE